MTENPDYWTSPEGLFKRIDMLTQNWTYRTYNGAIQMIGLVNEVEGFEWVTDIGTKTCDYCDSQSKRIYKLGQFMPNIPVHPNCHCSWRVIAR